MLGLPPAEHRAGTMISGSISSQTASLRNAGVTITFFWAFTNSFAVFIWFSEPRFAAVLTPSWTAGKQSYNKLLEHQIRL
jgi:hypothetical protein